MTRPTRRARIGAVLVAMVAALLVMTGCTVSGTPHPVGQGNEPGSVNTDQFDKLLLECEVLPAAKIAKAVGGAFASGAFNGAICRWVVSGAGTVYVTFNWFEWGTMETEQRTAKKLGYTTENIKIADTYTAFTQRDPKRPGVCGVTSKAPSRGVYTWWVEPRTPAADPCVAPIKLMSMVLTGSA